MSYRSAALNKELIAAVEAWKRPCKIMHLLSRGADPFAVDEVSLGVGIQHLHVSLMSDVIV
jgi:hypothetical protein